MMAAGLVRRHIRLYQYFLTFIQLSHQNQITDQPVSVNITIGIALHSQYRYIHRVKTIAMIVQFQHVCCYLHHQFQSVPYRSKKSIMLAKSQRSTMRAIVSFTFLLLAQLHHGISAPSPTGLSGFGARSNKKTIFPINANITASLSTPRSIANAIFSQERILYTDQPNLWAKRSKDPDVLWFQLRDFDNNTIQTLQVSVVGQSGDWKVEEPRQKIGTRSDDWIPIEGIYGFYKLPSGIIWILVTKSKHIYTAPPLQGGDDDTPWWQIRKVANLELVHLRYQGRSMSTAHLAEEVRQLRLLRQSLKEHEFYFVPSSQSGIVKDMTTDLQDSFKTKLATNNSILLWWESLTYRPDPRFFWNHAALEPILQRYESQSANPTQQSLLAALLQHSIPLTSAFVGIQKNVTDPTSGYSYDQLLISRRSRFRAGTRFTRRGADASGAVANFAETEQICLTLNGTFVQHVMSHLQTRGSIPLRWSSPTDVKTYRPRIRIGIDPLAQARALRQHLLEQFSYYVAVEDDGSRVGPENSSNVAKFAKLVFVNLIDKKKDQGRLGRAFDAVLKAVMDVYAVKPQEQEPPLPPRLYDLHSSPPPNKESNRKPIEEMLGDPKAVDHIWFDFHAEVKDGRWDRLTSLLNDLQPTLLDHGYFLAVAPNSTSDWSIQHLQKAIIRTNCMDCLDRTNVVQSLFGRYIFFQQLRDVVSDFASNETKAAWEAHSLEYDKSPTTLPWTTGEHAHRLLWADNADAISRLYAGTPALKGDFTRTGKRTRRGALDDGVNSLQRYYLNNFLDADRQEGMDLLVGHADFSNVEDDDDRIVNETIYISIKQAAREDFLGAFLGTLKENHRVEVQEQLGVMPHELPCQISGAQQAVNLRWLPGDLHGHMISNVETFLDDISTEGNDMDMFEYSSSKALASIDRRSTSGLPWWGDFDDDFCINSEDANVHFDKSSDGEECRRMIEMSPPIYHAAFRFDKSQLLGIVLVGLQAPRRLAMSVVFILGLLFLPDIIVHDFLKQ